jgi:hypothetical protein
LQPSSSSTTKKNVPAFFQNDCVIRDMNAFVRNELQVLYACLEHPEKARVPTIERSVQRIDWALRELLPGGHLQARAPVEEIDERSRNNAERSA